MNTLRVPFKFNQRTYALETIKDDSDEYYANLIGLAVQIEPGSLPISTFYGTEDPTFNENPRQNISNQVTRLVPEISIKQVFATSSNSDGGVNLSIKFQRKN